MLQIDGEFLCKRLLQYCKGYILDFIVLADEETASKEWMEQSTFGLKTVTLARPPSPPKVRRDTEFALNREIVPLTVIRPMTGQMQETENDCFMQNTTKQTR